MSVSEAELISHRELSPRLRFRVPIGQNAQHQEA